MLPTTLEIIRSGLKGDPSLSSADRTRLIALLRNGQANNQKAEPTAERVPCLLRRAEVARRLSCSLRTVDKLPLQKVKLPGRQRAAGFLESDVNAMLATKDTV